MTAPDPRAGGKVTRYRFMRDSMSDCFCDVDEAKDGELVMFADYDALRAECARLNVIAEQWRAKSETYAKERDALRDGSARLIAECARLSAVIGDGICAVPAKEHHGTPVTFHDEPGREYCADCGVDITPTTEPTHDRHA